MGIREATNTEKSLKLPFIRPGWRFDCLYALNLFENASMMLVFWIMLHTGTPHMFGLPTAAVACVFVQQNPSKNR
jgi:hypothetical protein